MKIQKLNQAGVAALEIILIVFVVLAVAGVGYYVWNAKKSTEKTLSDSAQGAGGASASQKTAKPTEVPKDETADWTEVKSKNGGFTIKFPGGWKVTNYGQSDSMRSNDIVLSNTKTTVNEVATPYAGDSQFKFHTELTSSYDFGTDLGTASTFSTGSLTGTKYTKTYETDTAPGVGERKKGEKMYIYQFKTSNGKTMFVTYNVYQGDQDQNDLVDKVVKTIKVN